MDKYQKQVKEMPDKKIVAVAEGHSRVTKFSLAFALLFGGGMIMLGLYLGTSIQGASSISLFCILIGILIIGLLALVLHDYKKLAEAALVEVSARGLDYDVKFLQIEKQENRKTTLSMFAVYAIVALLIAIGLYSCGGNYTKCPKCGDLYDTGSGGANYIITHGQCAECDYYD